MELAKTIQHPLTLSPRPTMVESLSAFDGSRADSDGVSALVLGWKTIVYTKRDLVTLSIGTSYYPCNWLRTGADSFMDTLVTLNLLSTWCPTLLVICGKHFSYILLLLLSNMMLALHKQLISITIPTHILSCIGVWFARSQILTNVLPLYLSKFGSGPIISALDTVSGQLG
jgi:hypothetical protein